jgi:ADP-ribose pyrophosphatase YjhB (NUDIX family)
MNKVIKVPNISNHSIIEVSASDLNFRISVYGICVADNQLLIHIHPKNPKKYNLPGGQLEKGESLVECITREFEEETGLKIKVNGLRTIREGFVNFGGAKSYQSIMVFYDVEQVGGVLGKMTGPDDDSSETKFVNINTETEDKLMDVFKGFAII